MVRRVPPPPEAVTVGPFAFTIEYGGEHWERHAEASETRQYGVCDFDQLRILIHPDLAPGMTKETLFHEIMHACYLTAGVNLEKLSEDIEETAVATLSPSLLSVLRTNPAVRAYILEA